jgi:cellulose biosynthesis protein BcsQ
LQQHAARFATTPASGRTSRAAAGETTLGHNAAEPDLAVGSPTDAQRVGDSRGFRVLTVTSNKGGVGKTTVATNLAVYFRALREDLPVLLIGLDDHHLIDRMFEIDTATRGPAIEAALRNGDLAPAIRLGQYGVHYVPSSAEISDLKQELRDPFYLLEVLRRTAWRGLVVIDTKSDLEILTRNAIAAADLSIVVVEDQLSIHEAVRVFELLDRYRKPRGSARVLLSLVDQRIKYDDPQRGDMLTLLRSEVDARGLPRFESFLARSPKVQSLGTNPAGRPLAILHNAKGSSVFRQMHELACEALQLLGESEFDEGAEPPPAAARPAPAPTRASAPTGPTGPTAAIDAEPEILLPVPTRGAGAPEDLGYRLAVRGVQLQEDGQRLLDQLKTRYREFFAMILDPITNCVPDMKELQADLERHPVDQHNFDAINAIALGFFEISYRAEAQKGSGMHYMGQSFRAARVAAVLWRAYGEVGDERLRNAIIDFFEDAARGEKLGARTTARTLAQMVASIERHEQDPARAARLQRASHALRRGGEPVEAWRDPRDMPGPRPSRAARNATAADEERRSS